MVSDNWPLGSALKAVLGALKVVFLVFCPLDFGFSVWGPEKSRNFKSASGNPTRHLPPGARASSVRSIFIFTMGRLFALALRNLFFFGTKDDHNDRK